MRDLKTLRPFRVEVGIPGHVVLPGATVPDAPVVSLSDPGVGGALDYSLTAPNMNGSALVRYEYEIDLSGVWTDVGTSLTGRLTGFTNDVPVTLSFRAVNGIGTGPAGSDTATPTLASSDVTDPTVDQIVFNTTTNKIEIGYTEASSPIKVYWQLRTQAATAPSRGDVIANIGGDTGGNYFANTNPHSQAISVTGIAAGAKTLYVVLEDPAGNLSIVAFASFNLATAPAAFADEDWSVAGNGVSGTIAYDIQNLPASNGATIEDIEYRIDGGAWTSSSGTSDFSRGGLVDETEVTTEIRAVNAHGPGPASSVKTATPTTVVSNGITVKSMTAFKEDGDAALTVKDIALPTYAENDTIVFVMGSDQAIGNGSAGIADFANYLDDGHTWTVLENNSGAANPGIMVAHKRMGPPPVLPDPPETIPLRPGNTKGVEGVFLVASGVNATNPVDNGHTVSTGATGLPDPGEHTTITNGALRIAAAALDDDIGALSGGPTGWDNSTPGPGDGNATASVLMATKAAPTAGADDPSALTGTGDDEWMAVHFALRPE